MSCLQQEDIEWYAEEVKDKLQSKGFENVSVNYDISYCQGCGASFTCQSIDLLKLAENYKEHFKDISKLALKVIASNFAFKLARKDWHYCHEYTVNYDYDYYTNFGDRTYNLVEKIGEIIAKIQVKESKEIYEKMCNINEWYWEDNNLLETINAHDVLFYEDGKIYGIGNKEVA